MHLLLIMSVFLLTCASATVQNVCELERPVLNNVGTLQELDQTLCDLPGLREDSQLQALTDNTRDIIRKLSAPESPRDDFSDDPLDDASLVAGLRSISDLLNDRRAPPTFRPVRNDEVSVSMTTLFSNFGTEAARRQNPQGYYQAMREVLSKTTQGARVLECFERSEPGVRGSAVEFFEPGEKRTSMAATFQARYNETGRDYSKVITLNSTNEPALTLTLLAHELQHSCDTQDSMRLQNDLRTLEERRDRLLGTDASQEVLDASADEIERFNAQINVSDAIDELRAYQMMPGIFSELATYHPAFFCQQYGAGKLFGRQVYNTGEFMSSLENKIADGSFIRTLIDSYTSGGGYDPASFYEIDESISDWRRDAQGNMILKPEVRATITAAGFRVP